MPAQTLSKPVSGGYILHVWPAGVRRWPEGSVEQPFETFEAALAKSRSLLAAPYGRLSAEPRFITDAAGGRFDRYRGVSLGASIWDSLEFA